MTGHSPPQPMMAGLPGPCVICGGTNYNLSCGGPMICPKCDCGQFDAATVMTQSKAIAALRAKVDELTAALMQARARIVYLGAACASSRHWEANEDTFLPAIDAVLSVNSQDRGST